MSVTEKLVEVEELLGKYEFPKEVEQDVRFRLLGEPDEAYVVQQLSYLKRVLEMKGLEKR